MLTNLGEDLKKIFLAGLDAVATTAEKSKEVIDELVEKGELTIEQGKVLNEELKHDIKKKVKQTVAAVNKTPDGTAVVESLDKLSPEELEAVKAKLAEMEKDDAPQQEQPAE